MSPSNLHRTSPSTRATSLFAAIADRAVASLVCPRRAFEPNGALPVLTASGARQSVGGVGGRQRLRYATRAAAIAASAAAEGSDGGISGGRVRPSGSTARTELAAAGRDRYGRLSGGVGCSGVAAKLMATDRILAATHVNAVARKIGKTTAASASRALPAKPVSNKRQNPQSRASRRRVQPLRDVARWFVQAIV